MRHSSQKHMGFVSIYRIRQLILIRIRRNEISYEESDYSSTIKEFHY